MQIRDLSLADLEAVHRLLCEAGWGHRVGTVDDFSRLLAASQRAAVAVSSVGDVIGFARGITDGISNGYLSMVVVAQHAQRQGVGSALVRHVMGEDPRITWVLRAGRAGAEEFFRALGFANSSLAMERPRG